MIDLLNRCLDKVYLYCKDQNWAGYDPFDGLNSPIVQRLSLLKEQKYFRLLFLQMNKKSPINLRALLGIRKGRNPKGIGLFLQGSLCLYEKTRDPRYYEAVQEFTRWLQENSSPGFSGKCWGYNFDWQSRAFFVPRGTPTVVNTSFIGRAFIKAFHIFKTPDFLDVARSSCDFILYDVNRLQEGSSIGFSYTPFDRYFVNNATALASSLLGLVYAQTRERGLGDMAKASAHFVASRQRPDGSWNYGKDQTALSVGIDNFHTGFILESLKIYAESTGDCDYRKQIEKGLCFFQDNFFLENGAPKYFYNKPYPLDIHSCAQAIVTLLQLSSYGSNSELCRKVLRWMLEEMHDRRGYFYYQKHQFFTNKISYIRWGQAWAFRALAEYLSFSPAVAQNQ
jgi:rhamnogalacturonyl hydrolase YesR